MFLRQSAAQAHRAAHSAATFVVCAAAAVLQAASRYVTAAEPLCRVPVVSMLEKDLLLELGHLEEEQVYSTFHID
jgi:hypothetical protein